MRNRIKLVVPPNLLKQENVCLIPRESEHPSNYNFITLSGDDRRAVSFAFLDFFSAVSHCWSILPIVKRLYHWFCQCGLLKRFEVLIIYQSALHTDALRFGFILMAVFTFQVVVLKRNYDGST